MLEANDVALLRVLSDAIDRLCSARDSLRDHGTVEVAIDDGHRARLAYEAIAQGPITPISGVDIGAQGWQHELRRLAHKGQVWL